ncbi:MAG: acetyl-CoA carboxylase carboxyltransferase subunit alpha [Nitrospirae bacterium]|nr:acetyl-CoA carboxylase carboxyltransferase subunit alpha [Candidatus Manganitrophaceae bacterium]
MKEQLDFEIPLVKIQDKINQLKDLGKTNPKVLDEIPKLAKKMAELQTEIYAKLSPWQITQLARHPKRPGTSDYLKMAFEGFVELHGDRLYGDDKSMITGFARLEGRSVIVIGHEKGKGVKDRIAHNFGMPHPEGYRKALRIMQLAEKFNKPIVTFVDTPGAYPGVEAEERGQSEAIARNLLVMSQLTVPIISVVIGEGGSGGALAISVADQMLMLEYSIYSVISPEGCAAILWDDPTKSEDAAASLRMTAKDLLDLKIIEHVISEPLGGAHCDPEKMAESVSRTICKQLSALDLIPPEERVKQRYARLRKIGAFTEDPPGPVDN